MREYELSLNSILCLKNSVFKDRIYDSLYQKTRVSENLYVRIFPSFIVPSWKPWIYLRRIDQIEKDFVGNKCFGSKEKSWDNYKIVNKQTLVKEDIFDGYRPLTCNFAENGTDCKYFSINFSTLQKHLIKPPIEKECFWNLMYV